MRSLRPGYWTPVLASRSRIVIYSEWLTNSCTICTDNIFFPRVVLRVKNIDTFLNPENIIVDTYESEVESI